MSGCSRSAQRQGNSWAVRHGNAGCKRETLILRAREHALWAQGASLGGCKRLTVANLLPTTSAELGLVAAGTASRWVEKLGRLRHCRSLACDHGREVRRWHGGIRQVASNSLQPGGGSRRA